MEDLTQQLMAAIEESVPAIQATALKDRLVEADDDRALVKELQGQIKSKDVLLEKHRAEVEVLKHRVSDQKQLREDQGQLVKGQQRLKLDQELLALEKKHATERVSELRNITATVFQSNRLGYNLNLTGPGGTDQYGNQQYSNFDGSINKQE